MTDAMTKTRIDYRPAATDDAWWLAVDGDAVVLLSPAVSAATATGVWRGLGTGGIGAVLEALTSAFGTSLTAIPPFALAIAEAGGVRVAVRGDVEVVVEGQHPEAVSGAGVATWTERFVPGAVRVSVAPHAGSPAPAADLPLRSGVVRTDLVEIDLAVVSAASASPVPPAASAPAVAVAVAPATGPSVAEDASDAEEQPGIATSSASAISPASVIDSVPPGLLGGAPEPEPVREAGPEPEPEGEPQAAPAAPAADTSADTLIPEATAAEEVAAPVDEYDLLWGETVARPVSAAAIAAVDPEAESAAEASPAAPAANNATSAGDGDDLGDHDGATIAVAEMRALRAERPAFDSTDNVPARRPARGRIRLSTGRVVELERPVIIGRRPKSTRTTGADLPTLVAVDSPDQDISRSHVEIRAEGEHVLVTDLDTTNGTVLLRGGSEPVRLHPNEPTMVVTGDVLDLGDDVTVTFEDLP
ncbi:MAG: Forkhead-associated protein [Microbacterium sp. SCN 69-37]|nr:MAG: Forkhead-associated protein [Microbacterium sp. SCN 69-37]